MAEFRLNLKITADTTMSTSASSAKVLQFSAFDSCHDGDEEERMRSFQLKVSGPDIVAKLKRQLELVTDPLKQRREGGGADGGLADGGTRDPAAGQGESCSSKGDSSAVKAAQNAYGGLIDAGHNKLVEHSVASRYFGVRNLATKPVGGSKAWSTVEQKQLLSDLLRLHTKQVFVVTDAGTGDPTGEAVFELRTPSSLKAFKDCLRNARHFRGEGGIEFSR